MSADAAHGEVSGTRPLRLLVISNMWPSPANPVFGSFVARQVSALCGIGAEVDVVANTDNRTGPIAAARKYASLSWRAWRAGRSGRSGGHGTYDAVIGHFLYPTAIFARLAARAAAAPYVLVAHGTDSRSVMRSGPLAAACRAAMRSASLVVSVSGALRDALRDVVGAEPGVPVAVVHMGYAEDVFVPDADARSTLGMAESERVVLFVGNLVPVKGADVLIDAFAALVRRGAADRLVFVGSGPLAASLYALAERQDDVGADGARPSERITLTGALSQEAVARHMAAADVLALPSRSEGLGTVLLEAMACGTPCVASNVGGIPEILDESCGRLVPVGDAEAVARGIEEVLSAGKAHFAPACLARASGHGSEAQARRFVEQLSGVVAG